MNIVAATIKDIPQIIEFIKALAHYEKMDDAVKVTEELLEEWLFMKKKAEVVLLMKEEKPIGFALYFYNFSTFVGKPGIYLEDIYIVPKQRNQGYGKEVFTYLAKQAHTLGFERIEWSCLNWNEPSIAFYLKMQAKPMNEWTVFRLNKEAIRILATNEEN